MSKLKKAIEKAKVERQEPGAAVVTPGNASGMPQGAVIAPGGPKVESSKPVPAPAPKPTKTRVVRLNHEHLKKNRIVSLFRQGQVSDQIKILRTQVLNRMKELKGNSLMITSANPKEGKTLTAINLAVSIAQEVNRTTLLVDADLRNPSIHHVLGFEVKQGLSDYLLGKAELESLFVNPGVDKLTILPAGKPFPDSTELLGGPIMDALVRELKDRYKDRFVIFDTTSLLTRADAIVFSNYIDGILLIVEAERTTSRQLERAMTLLKDRPLVGTMFNKAKSFES